MEKTISIDNKEFKFKATADTPRVYRHAFGRDIYIDTQKLFAEYFSEKELSADSLDIVENIAFCMNAQAEGRKLNRETIEEDMSEWLSQFEMFSIYRILSKLIELWNLNTKQTIKPKKEPARQSDK